MEPDGYRSQVTPKTAATVALTVLAIAFAAWFVWNTGVVLALTLFAILISVSLNRAVHWLELRRVPRGIGILLVMLAVIGVLVGLGFLFIPLAVSQISQLIGELPNLVKKLQQTDLPPGLKRYLSLDQLLGQVKSRAPSLVGEIVNPAITVVTWVGGIVFAVVTVLFLVIFMLAAGRPLVLAALAQSRPEKRGSWAKLLLEIYHSLGGYIAGLFSIVLINSAFTSTYLALAKVPFFFALGVAAGFSSLIPYAGATITGALISIFAWANNGLWTGVGTAIYFVAYQQFENHVISPLVYRRAIELNPLVIILGALFIADVWGITGAVLAVPLVAVGQIILREVLRLRREQLQIPGETTPELFRPEQAPPTRPQ